MVTANYCTHDKFSMYVKDKKQTICDKVGVNANAMLYLFSPWISAAVALKISSKGETHDYAIYSIQCGCRYFHKGNLKKKLFPMPT